MLGSWQRGRYLVKKCKYFFCRYIEITLKCEVLSVISVLKGIRISLIHLAVLKKNAIFAE